MNDQILEDVAHIIVAMRKIPVECRLDAIVFVSKMLIEYGVDVFDKKPEEIGENRGST